MSFEEFYFKTIGISLSDAKTRGVADLEIIEQAFNAGGINTKRWQEAAYTIADDLMAMKERADSYRDTLEQIASIETSWSGCQRIARCLCRH